MNNFYHLTSTSIIQTEATGSAIVKDSISIEKKIINSASTISQTKYIKSKPVIDRFMLNKTKREISELEKQLKLHPSRTDIRMKIMQLRTFISKHKVK